MHLATILLCVQLHEMMDPKTLVHNLNNSCSGATKVGGLHTMEPGGPHNTSKYFRAQNLRK